MQPPQNMKLNMTWLHELHPAFHDALVTVIGEQAQSPVDVALDAQTGRVRVESLLTPPAFAPVEQTGTPLAAMAADALAGFETALQRLQRVQAVLAEKGIPADISELGRVSVVMGARFGPSLDETGEQGLILEHEGELDEHVISFHVDGKGRVRAAGMDNVTFPVPLPLCEPGIDTLPDRLNHCAALLNPEHESDIRWQEIADLFGASLGKETL